MKRRGIEPMHGDHVNVTPLIDVVMCLIIFFLTCARLAQSEASDQVRIPRADLGQDMPDQRGRLLINVYPHNPIKDKDGRPVINPGEMPEIVIRGNTLRQQDLTAFLRKEKQESPDLKVILRADRDCPYDWISPVLVSCVQANIKSVNFSTQK